MSSSIKTSRRWVRLSVLFPSFVTAPKLFNVICSGPEMNGPWRVHWLLAASAFCIFVTPRGHFASRPCNNSRERNAGKFLLNWHDNVPVLIFAFQVVGVQQYVVKPSTADTAEGFLSAEVLLNNSLTEDLVRKGLPLEVVITQVSAVFNGNSSWTRLHSMACSISFFC